MIILCAPSRDRSIIVVGSRYGAAAKEGADGVEEGAHGVMSYGDGDDSDVKTRIEEFSFHVLSSTPTIPWIWFDGTYLAYFSILGD